MFRASSFVTTEGCSRVIFFAITVDKKSKVFIIFINRSKGNDAYPKLEFQIMYHLLIGMNKY